MAMPSPVIGVNSDYPLGRLVTLIKLLKSSSSEVRVAWAIWAGFTLAIICFVAVFGLQSPFGDEWEWVGRATGNEPVTLAWLWSQHNEHRMFLPRLIYMGLGALTGIDFRASQFFDVFLLSGLSFSMMAAARVVRGKTCLCDAFFPLVLLNWGQSENLVWGFQMAFVTSVFLEGVILLIILRCGERISLKSCLLVVVCLLLLGLCGSNGVVFLLPLACWLFYASLREWRSGALHGKRNALMMFVLAAMPAAFVVLYFQGLHTAVARQSVYATLRTFLQFLTEGIGPAAKEIWPVSGVLALCVCGLIVWQCLTVFRNRPGQRVRAAGFLMFFAGIMALALSIGVGRAYFGPLAGFEVRYITLAVPLLLLLFLQAEAHGGPALKRHVPRLLFVIMAALFVVNAQKGISYSINLWSRLEKFEQDMRNDVPPECLGLRYADQWGYGNREVFTNRLIWLRSARLGPYRRAMLNSGRRMEVESICRREPQSHINEPVRLSAGQSFTQHFSVKEGGILRRIDLQMIIDREARSLERLHWALFKIDSDGKKVQSREDCIDLSKACGDDYVSIPLDDVAIPETRRFVLILRVPDDAPGKGSVAIPMYQVAANKETEEQGGGENHSLDGEIAGGLKGFVYLEPDGRSAPQVAGRAEEKK